MSEHPLREILAVNVRRFRYELGYSQFELAEYIGISPGYMCDIENGRKWPSADIFLKLAKNLNMDPYQLLIPSQDSPHFDRHRTLTSFTQQIKAVLTDSVDAAYEKFMQPYGSPGSEDQ